MGRGDLTGNTRQWLGPQARRMAVDRPGQDAVCAMNATPIPNNLGPTLLLAMPRRQSRRSRGCSDQALTARLAQQQRLTPGSPDQQQPEGEQRQ